MNISPLYLVMLLFLLQGCATTTSSSESRRGTGIFISSPISSISENTSKVINKKNNDIYKIIVINFNDGSKGENLDEMFKSFGESLGELGVIIDVSQDSDYNKKAFFIEQQKKLRSNYEFYDSPFLIFLKENSEKIEPYKILSFGGSPNDCIKKDLLRIEKEIHIKSSKNDVANRLSRLRLHGCSLSKYLPEEYSKSNDLLDELIKILKDLI